MRASRSSFASACSSWGALLALVAACSRPSPGDAAPRPSTSSPEAPSTPPAPAASAVPPAPVDPYVTADATRSKSIGHTSYVLQLTLEGGAKAAFKPRSKLPLGDRRYKGEIAAYRLASALGIDNVPRAIPRAFDGAKLRALQAGFDEKGLVDDDGRVRGALMPWIANYRVLPVEESTWRERWERWLFDGKSAIESDQRALASSISTMLVFDYVTANWDRWSGGNVAQDGEGGKVLFVDNDGAFYERPSPETLSRQLATVKRVTRFSRRFASALRALNAASLREAFGEESPGVALLPDGVILGVEERRVAAVSAIDARRKAVGEDATYAFE
jgi:hypothetical protein